MNKYKALLNDSPGFILFIILSIIFVAYSAKRSSSSDVATQDKNQGIISTPFNVENKTDSFELLMVEQKGWHARLTLKNNY